MGNNYLKGIIQYVIWSRVIICPSCTSEFNFWDVAYDDDDNRKKEIQCPLCKTKAESRKFTSRIVTKKDCTPISLTFSILSPFSKF